MGTMREVAGRAGVSIATVSAVLSGNRYVSPELADRVNRAIAETGYRRNSLASGLKSGRTHLVGLVVPDITNPFFTDFVDLIETQAQAAGFSIIFGISKGNPAREREIVDLMRSNQVEGTIVCPAGSPEDTRALFEAYGGPMVAVDNADPDGPVDSVTLDNREAGLIAAHHLLELGHRRLGLVTGPSERVSAVRRQEGFLGTLASESLSQTVTLNGEFSAAGGYQACRELLATDPLPTALFVTNNLMLIGVMRALAEAGSDVPGDISVLSVDDFPWAGSFRPALTTIRQPLAEIVAESWRIFSARLADPKALPQSVVLRPELVIRSSTAPIAGGRKSGAATRARAQR